MCCGKTARCMPIGLIEQRSGAAKRLLVTLRLSAFCRYPCTRNSYTAVAASLTCKLETCTSTGGRSSWPTSLHTASYPSVLIPPRYKSTDQPTFSIYQRGIHIMNLVNSQDLAKPAVQCPKRHKPEVKRTLSRVEPFSDVEHAAPGSRRVRPVVLCSSPVSGPNPALENLALFGLAHIKYLIAIIDHNAYSTRWRTPAGCPG